MELNIDERVTSQRQQALFIRCKKMSSWICILLYTRSEDITIIIIIIIIVWRKTNKVVVSSLVSAFFSVFFLLICYVRSFTKENRQARKYNRIVEDDKIILIDSHCHCRSRSIRMTSGVFFDELEREWERERERLAWWIKAICSFFFSPCIFRSYADEWTRTFVFSLPVNYYWYPRKIMRKKNVEDLCHYNDFLFPLYRDRMHRWMTEHLVLRRFREDEITRSSKKKKDYSFDNQHQLGDNIDHLFIIFAGCIFLSVCLSLSLAAMYWMSMMRSYF
jgi:hypothetical protein